MRKLWLPALVLFACALSVAYLLGGAWVAAAQETHETWNTEYLGSATFDGQVDAMPYSKLSPWPHTQGRYLYSGCYLPNRCFFTVDLKDHTRPQRLTTFYTYDPIKSPAPPFPHPVWTDPLYANLTVPPMDANGRRSCGDWIGYQPGNSVTPTCWDPGWNTHSHYVQNFGNILAVNQERWRTAANNVRPNYHGVKFYDVSDPANPMFLSYWEAPADDRHADGTYTAAGGVHHFNWKDRYLYLGTEYRGFVNTSKILVILDVKDPRRPVEVAKWWIKGQRNDEYPTADWTQASSFGSPVVKLPSGKWRKHVGMHYVAVFGNTAYLSYHQAGLVILDVRDNANPKFLSRLDYLNPDLIATLDPLTPPAHNDACHTAAGTSVAACGNTHSAKLVPGSHLLWVTDEYFSCPYGHLRMVDVSDLTNPQIISHYLFPENTDCSKTWPLTGPSSHLGNAWGDGLLFLAWYGLGLHVFDIANPYYPVEVGYFKYQLDASNPSLQGSQTYDVIFGPGGYLYVSDGSKGLRVLKYTGRGGPQE